MSQENVEVVRRAVEAWQRDDLETWLALIDPDMEYHPAIRRVLEGGASLYRGHDGMREFWTFWRTEADDFRLESQELRDLPDGRVLHLARIRWRGAASGVEVESPYGMVVTVRGGKIVHSIDCLSHDEALEAAVGLRE
jgi:ketosteroid isomerase-like protein